MICGAWKKSSIQDGFLPKFLHRWSAAILSCGRRGRREINRCAGCRMRDRKSSEKQQINWDIVWREVLGNQSIDNILTIFCFPGLGAMLASGGRRWRGNSWSVDCTLRDRESSANRYLIKKIVRHVRLRTQQILFVFWPFLCCPRS